MSPLRSVLPITFLSCCLFLTGCVPNHINPITDVTPATVSGNWFIYNLSTPNAAHTGFNGLPFIGGSLVVTSNQVSGVFHTDQPCIGSSATDVPYTGTITGNQIALTSSPINGEVLTIQGTIASSGTSFVGNSLTLSGTCSGTVVAATGSEGPGATFNPIAYQLPALTGTWKSLSGDTPPQLSFTFTQAATPDAHGHFAVSGTVAVQGSACFSSGVIQPSSYISGDVGQLTVLLNDGSTLTASLLAGAIVGESRLNVGVDSANITGGSCNASGLNLPLQ